MCSIQSLFGEGRVTAARGRREAVSGSAVAVAGTTGAVTAATKANEANQAARRAAGSVWGDRLARLGFCARGVVYAIVGVIALQIALRSASGDLDASKEGALREIAERPFGRPLLVVLAIGLGGYVVWRASEAAWGKRDEDDEHKRTLKRAGSAAKALLYGAFLGSTVKFISGGPSQPAAGSGQEREATLTARLLDLPAGQLMVGGVGLAIVGGGAYVLYRGIAQKFEKHLDIAAMGPVVGRVVDVVGTVGMAARGVVFGVAGYLLIRAAIDFDPDQATGLDGTLKAIARQTYGQVLLTVTAVGLIAYGLYSFAEARYRDL